MFLYATHFLHRCFSKRACWENILYELQKILNRYPPVYWGISILWLPKLYDLRKKYEQELAEIYLIIESMDDDLLKKITEVKD